MSELSLFVTASGPDPADSFMFDGHPVRVIFTADGSRFVLTDVARLLGYRDARDASRLLRDGQKGYAELRTPGGPQQMLVCTEPGLYRLLLKSNATNADAVQDWVTDEVLPAINRTGQYVPEQRASLSPRELAQLVILEADRADQAEREVLALKPRAQGYDTWVSTGVTVEIGAAAKVLASFGVKVGRTRLYRDLRAQGWVFQNSTEPKQHAVEAGWVVVEFGKAYDHPTTGEPMNGGPRTRLTPKGLERLLSHRYGVPVSDAFRSAVAAAGEA